MKTGLVILGGLLLLGSFGCAPRLAQTSLGDEEQRWQKHIKQSYPAWTPPQTTPPNASSNVVVELISDTDSDLAVETETVVLLDQPETTVTPAVTPVAPVSTPVAPVSTPVAAAARSYTVQKGDTLSAISAKMYNTSKNVDRILDANRTIIKDKNLIRPGMKLVIPAL
jgi:LysM repeat protein